MKNHQFLLLCLLSFFVFYGCSPYKTLVVKKDLETAYQAAVKDASAPTLSEVSGKLWAISPDNPDLIRNENGEILVVTWTNWNGYDNKVGTSLDLAREIWVTAAPQLQRFSENLSLDSAKMTLRLEQLLGLPPHNGKNRFVEMWVSPNSLFRPCPDPEVTDIACGTAYAVSAYAVVPEVHKTWIENLRQASYGEKGYPWTQLGYTYDWGNPKNEVGLSEFVVQKGAKATIKGVYNIYQYCGAKK